MKTLWRLPFAAAPVHAQYLTTTAAGGGGQITNSSNGAAANSAFVGNRTKKDLQELVRLMRRFTDDLLAWRA